MRRCPRTWRRHSGPQLVTALRDVREILERARRSGDMRELEAAIEWINRELDGKGHR